MEKDYKYDYLIVGSGLYGSIMAHELFKHGYKVLIIEKRNHVGGNIYTEYRDNIDIHIYGAHIFHTSNEKIWKYVNSFVKFNNFINSPLAFYKGNYYQVQIYTDTDEDFYIDTQDEWDNNDRVGVKIDKEKMIVEKVEDEDEKA